MITRNDYSLGLFNGDLGVVHPLPDSAEPMVFFPANAGRVRAVAPFRIADHQTAYAMTVHKSQGSEFDEVLLVLPAADSPVLSRELVYTGVTRARRKVVIFGSEAILSSAISRKVERTSGLLDALWGGGGQQA
jgi:exodeoxyribonuclease V alpha subunit